MANVTKDSLNPIGHTAGTPVANYITQVKLADNTVYDIATHHSINFKDGSNGDATPWNGLEDITIVIPNVSDLVATPIDFVGTIGSDGNITYSQAAGGTNHENKAGDLVFAAANCTFTTSTGNTAALEAGDMAIYDGTKWIPISGENQISITGIESATSKEFAIKGAAQNVLSVEGKDLQLSLDYSDINDHLVVTTSTLDVNIDNNNTTFQTESTYLTFASSAASSDITIGSLKTLNDYPTALASGTVNFADGTKVFQESDLTAANVFSAGAFPVYTKNNAAVTAPVSASGTVNTSFYSAGSAIDSATFVSASDADTDKFTAVTSVTATTTTSYLTSLTAVSADTENPDVTLSGAISFNNNGTDLLKGLETTSSSATSVTDASDAVITGATIGAVTVDSGTSASHNVLTGVGEGSDFLTSAALAADTNSAFKASAIATATVSSNVLTFTSGDYMTPVKVDTSASGFTYGTVNQANSTFYTRKFTKGGYTQGVNKYNWAKSNEVTVNAPTSSVKISTTQANFTQTAVGTVNVEGNATIAANTFLDGTQSSAGTLPAWTAPSATGTLSASVNTSLAVTTVSFNTLTSTTISGYPTYSLTRSDTSSTGAIEVAKAGDLATATIAATVSGVVVDVDFNESATVTTD